MLSNRVFFGLAALLAMFTAGLPAYGQDHEVEGAALFEPADVRPYDNWAQPKTGLFFTFDGLCWNISTPNKTTIGDPTFTPTVYYFPTADSYFEHNTLDTGLIQAKWKFGDRMEFGYVDEGRGVLFSTLNLNSQTTVFDQNTVSVVFNDPIQNAQGLHLLDIVFTRDVNGFPATFGMAPVVFNTMHVINKTRLQGCEALYLIRPPQLQHGGMLEFFLGGRFVELKDQFWVDATGGNLADSYWNTTSKNEIGGPEIGARWFKPWGRFGISADGRFTAGLNSQTIHQDGVLGSTLGSAGNSNAAPLPALMYSSGINNTAHFTEFTPIIELRAEAHVQLTNLISAKAGWTGIWMNNVARACDMIDYTVNQMGITTANGGDRQQVFINGLTLSVELNR